MQGFCCFGRGSESRRVKLVGGQSCGGKGSGVSCATCDGWNARNIRFVLLQYCNVNIHMQINHTALSLLGESFGLGTVLKFCAVATGALLLQFTEELGHRVLVLRCAQQLRRMRLPQRDVGVAQRIDIHLRHVGEVPLQRRMIWLKGNHSVVLRPVESRAPSLQTRTKRVKPRKAGGQSRVLKACQSYASRFGRTIRAKPGRGP